MSESLFDYENRRFREEVLYLLRQLAEYQGIIPFDEKDRRRHVDPDWDGCVSEDPQTFLERVLHDAPIGIALNDAQVGEVLRVKLTSNAPTMPNPVKTRRPRFDWMENDSEIKKAEELRTGWNARAKAMKDPKAVASAIAASNDARKYAGRRRKKIETEIKKGRAEIVDGVLYDLRSGVRAPWNAALLVTK
jgi:hypothetical protein